MCIIYQEKNLITASRLTQSKFFSRKKKFFFSCSIVFIMGTTLYPLTIIITGNLTDLKSLGPEGVQISEMFCIIMVIYNMVLMKHFVVSD